VAWSLALVSLCGLLLGYYILQTYFVPKTRQYQLDFGDARWIEPAKPGPTAYFRTEVFLSSAPEQAWLEIAATDNFRVVVNSRTLGVESNVKTRVAGIYDMKKALKAGTNVIAVSIARTSFPGSAQLLVRGLIKERGGEEIPLISDAQWRVTTETGIVRGSADWTSAAVDQELWPKAMPSEIAKNSVPIAWVDLNPLVLQAPLIGSWITSENAASEVTFSTFLQADRFREETWLQIASSGDVDLVINGHLIVTAMDSLSGNKGLPELPPAPHNTALASAARPETIERATAQSAKSAKITSEKAALEISDVSYWIKSGQNSIVATVRADHRPASLLISGFFVRSDGTVHPFATNSDWLAKDRLNASAEPKSQRGVQLGSNGSAPWGYLLQEVAKPIDRTGFTSFIGSCLVLLVTAAATLGLWLFASGFVTKRRRGLLRDVMLRDALFHAPIIVALLLLLLPNYDPRFPGDWSFKPWIVFAAIVGLLAVRCLHFVPAGAVVPKPRIRLPQLDRSLVPYLFLAIIMGLGFGLRFHNLGYISFDHDEMGLIVRSKGIYSLGFPYSVYAGVIRWITTYEAVPYPLALAGLFGYTEWTLRMPACLMGTLCIGIMALLGRRLFNWRTGLIAALVYACLPLDIRWAQNSFYPQQCQFMGLLTIYLFYEAVRFRPLRHGYLTAATVSFCLTYLSWEGSAFLLPSLFIGLLVLRWGEWWWLKEFHLYRCLFFIGAVVIAQYCSRMLAGAPYLQVGSGLSNLIGPSLFFLTPAYQPLFYVYNLWLTENHVFFTVVAIVGLPFCWSHRGFRYVFAMLVSLWILHTNFIAALAPRYAYYYQPLLVLSGVAATVILCEALVALARRESSSAIAILCSQVSAVVLMALLFLTSNDWLFKEYQLSTNGDQPGLMTRMNTYRYDYRGAAHYVSAHYQAGDVVLPGVPHIFAFYAGRPGDYFVDTLLASKVPYNPFLPQPGFIDKFGGLPVLRNLDELKEVTSRARRVWVVAVPIAALDRLNSPAVLEYLDSVGHSVFESYRAKVLLIENQSQIKEERNGGRASVK
jgi:hypothetical protein